MTVLIKGMEMPENCGECHFSHTENFKTWCCPTEREDILYDAIPEWCPLAEPKTGKCETCKRNADNGGFYDDGRTRCPIQEHYALLKDGYCHLYEPRMRGEEE